MYWTCPYLNGTIRYVLWINVNYIVAEDNTRIPVELTELRDIGIKQAMFGVDDEEPFLVILTKGLTQKWIAQNLVPYIIN